MNQVFRIDNSKKDKKRAINGDINDSSILLTLLKYVYVFFLALCKDSKNDFFTRIGNIDVSDFNPCHDQCYYPLSFC